jgi:hypothetical protein
MMPTVLFAMLNGLIGLVAGTAGFMIAVVVPVILRACHVDVFELLVFRLLRLLVWIADSWAWVIVLMVAPFVLVPTLSFLLVRAILLHGAVPAGGAHGLSSMVGLACSFAAYMFCWSTFWNARRQAGRRAGL